MILSALACALAAAEEEDPLSPHRVPFDELMERTIGTASQPVEFNWRRTTAHAAVTGSHLFELNNFESLRLGGLARFPSGSAIVELGVTYVGTWDTPSSELMALTPYRQPGRPDRMDIDIAVGLPLAEGVVTFAPRFLPSVQLVFNGYVGLRYHLYPDAFAGMEGLDVFGAIFSPALTQAEIDNLDDRRLAAMQVDPGRYGLVVGVGDDIYFKQGLFLSPRVMFSVPVLATVSGSELLWWSDFSLAVGLAL